MTIRNKVLASTKTAIVIYPVKTLTVTPEMDLR